MDYFTLLNLSQTFDLDQSALEKSYFRAQRQFHPDRFVGKPDHERMAAMQRSVDMNKAYESLKDPLTRAQHLLSLQGVLVGGDKDTVKPSQALLMEIMELRETPPDAKILAEMVESCITRIDQQFRANDWPAMAEETLRLGYLVKVTILRRGEAESAGSHAMDGDPVQSLRASQDDNT